jgi:predicted DCC family thiol-disulfide oxidoreductase YuxK
VCGCNREREVQVEVFRRLYEMVGLGWVYAVTRLPGVGPAADAVYDLWAKYRLPITGRPDLLEVVKRRAENTNCREERAKQGTAASTPTTGGESRE